MSRTIVIAGTALLGALLLASLSYGRPAPARGNVGDTACPSGSVSARIGGRLRCLRAGQRCRKRYDRQYRRHGFHCRAGRLERSLPSAGKVVATIRLHTGPLGAVFADDTLWVAEHNAGTVARIDPGTNKVTARVRIPSGQPARFAAGPEGLWHLPYSDNTLQELDPATNRVSAHITDLGGEDDNCCDPAVGAGSVWVPKGEDGVFRVDASTHRVLAHVSIDRFFGTAFAFGSLWGITGGDVFRLDPATNSIGVRIPVPGLARLNLFSDIAPAIGVASGAVWVGLGKEIVRIDPTSNSVVATIPVPGIAEFIARTDEGVWVVGTSPSDTTTLWRIDPTANKVTAALSLSPSGAADVVAAAGSLWITLFRMNELLRVQPAPSAAG
jgi:DNA-binding beta-propeller fold protein YncE